MELRDWLFVIGAMGFGLVTIIAVFWPIIAWAGDDICECQEGRKVSWLTPPLDESMTKEEVRNDVLVVVGRRVHSPVA